jgi:hypothetical protein
MDGGGGTTTLAAPVVVPNVPAVISVTYGASGELRHNLTSVSTGSMLGSNSGTSTVIAGRLSGDSTAGPVAIAEVACYTATLSTANLVGATQELMAKYRIPRPGVVVG